jgi:hypothetical protein
MQHSLSKSAKRLYIMANNQNAIKKQMLDAEITEKMMKLNRRKEKDQDLRDDINNKLESHIKNSK